MPDGYTDLGFARVDTDRRRRCGFPEVIFGMGKTPEQVVAIARVILEKENVLLVSRATGEQWRLVVAEFPEARWHERARCITVERVALPKLGGTIAVTSVEGAGSNFTFTLPYNPKKEQQAQSNKYKALSTQDSALTTILIVEDDPTSTLLLQRNLKGQNLTILCAENGWEAVELVEHHPEINLVLMDIKMPVMNGYEATRLIKEQRPDLPVIAQSAFTSNEEREKARKAGCDSFITKPINKTELLELITKQLHP